MMVNHQQADRVMELWDPIKHSAFRIVNSITGDRLLTEDVLQEALVIAFRRFHTIRDEAKFAPWFYKTAVRIAYRLQNKHKKVIPIEDVYAQVEGRAEMVDDTLVKVEHKDTVIRILRMLPDKERHLFHLRYVEDMKITDIAVITGIKVGTLKSIYHRMCKRLSQSLQEEYGYE